MEQDNTLVAVEVIEGDPVKWKVSATDETYGFIEFQKTEYVSNEDDPQNPTEVVTTVAIAWVEYFPSDAPVAGGDVFSFAYPDNVSGAILMKLSDLEGEDFELPSDFPDGISAENIYILLYQTEWPNMASIKVPCLPDYGLAWGAPESGSYWLTYDEDEDAENQIYVVMSETEQVDFFKFTVGSTLYFLICTRV